MRQFIAVNALAVCSISIIVKQPESIRSISCTLRVTRVEPGSVAAAAGIEEGALILQVDRQSVRDAAEFQRVVGESSADKRVLLLLRQGDVQRFAVLSW